MLNNRGIAVYLWGTFYPDSLETNISATKQKINDLNLKFDAIAFTGVSGAAFGFPLCYELGKRPIYLRKKRSTHSSFLIETAVSENAKFLIVDDVVDSGKTLRRILKYLGKDNCIGMITYHYGIHFKPIEKL